MYTGLKIEPIHGRVNNYYIVQTVTPSATSVAPEENTTDRELSDSAHSVTFDVSQSDGAISSKVIHPRYPTTTSMSRTQFTHDIKDDEFRDLCTRIANLENKAPDDVLELKAEFEKSLSDMATSIHDMDKMVTHISHKQLDEISDISKLTRQISDFQARVDHLENAKIPNSPDLDKRVSNLRSDMNIMKSDIEKHLKLMQGNIERNSMVIADKTELMMEILKKNKLM